MPNFNKGIEIQLKRMDQRKRMLMSLISSIPDKQYRHQPDPDSWSVGQIANHLYLSEKLSLAYLEKKLSYPDTIPGFSFKSWWSLFLIKFTLRTPLKVKAPQRINMWENQDVLSPGELDQCWNLVRVELANVISANQQRFGTHLVYNHPYAGRLTMKQMLIFFNHHIAHHLRQARHTIRKIH